MTRIWILGSDETTCAIVEALGATHPDWNIECIGDGEPSWAKLKEGYGLVLAESSSVTRDEFAILKRIRNEYPGVPVVMLTPTGPDSLVVAALRLGAASYVPKSILARDLATTIERILALRGPAVAHERLQRQQVSVTHAFQLENDRSIVAPVVHFVQAEMHRLMEDAESWQMRVATAIEEALMNAIVHGNLEVASKLREGDSEAYHSLVERRREEAPYRERRVDLRLTLSRDRLECVIRDEGPGFDVRGVPDPRDEENLMKCSGRGLLLMMSFMDEVAFNEKGNEVMMRIDVRPNGDEDEM